MLFKLPDPSIYTSEFQSKQFIVVRDFLPRELISEWCAQAKTCVQHYGKDINQTLTERTLRYRVVTGEMIRDHFEELFSFYCSPSIIKWMTAVIGVSKLYVSNHIRSAININSMAQPTERYPWHFDAVPYTAMLYLTTSDFDHGGALEVYPNLKISHDVTPTPAELKKAEKLHILPEAGMLILMNGTCCYHSVTPLLKSEQRISVPMVFPVELMHERPVEVDEFIYGAD